MTLTRSLVVRPATPVGLAFAARFTPTTFLTLDSAAVGGLVTGIRAQYGTLPVADSLPASFAVRGGIGAGVVTASGGTIGAGRVRVVAPGGARTWLVATVAGVTDSVEVRVAGLRATFIVDTATGLAASGSGRRRRSWRGTSGAT